MKRKVISLVLLSIVVLVMFIPGTLAFMFNKTQTIVNSFTPAQVSCKVEETFDGEKKTSIQVQNTSNIDAYIRVCVVSRWEDSKGNPVPWDAPEFNVTLQSTDKWFEKDGFYYYKLPVKPDALTDNLLTNEIELFPQTKTVGEGVNAQIFTYYPVIDIIAEAIQSVPNDPPPGRSAVQESWKVVKVTKDDKGNLCLSPATSSDS